MVWKFTSRDYCVLAALLALAAIPRFVGIGNLEIGPDEGYSFFAATAPQGVIAALHGDANPPLYFLLLHAWLALFGGSLAAGRAMSAFFGLLLVPLTGALAWQCGAARRTTWWTMALVAFVPLQVFYGREARGYTLDLCLLVSAMLAFILALRTGNARSWAAHALLLAAGACAHYLLIPMAALYWVAALAMKLQRPQWKALLTAHTAAAFLMIPALLLMLTRQSTGNGTDWIAQLWQRTPPAAALPQSLEVLGLGGWMPLYMPLFSLPRWAALAAVLLTTLALVAAIWPARSTPAQSAPGGWHEFGALRWLLAAFALGPPLMIWLYSCIAHPIYLVGRYDLFGQPAYLCLLAAGFSRLTAMRRIVGPLAQVALPAAASVLLAWGINEQWAAARDLVPPVHRERAAYFVQQNGTGDWVICAGLEATQTMYYLNRAGLAPALRTFPRDTQEHLGWFDSDAMLAAQAPRFSSDADTLMTQARAAGATHLWLYLDRAAASDARRQLTQTLLTAAAVHGWRPLHSDQEHRDTEDQLSVELLVQDKATASGM